MPGIARSFLALPGCADEEVYNWGSWPTQTKWVARFVSPICSPPISHSWRCQVVLRSVHTGIRTWNLSLLCSGRSRSSLPCIGCALTGQCLAGWVQAPVWPSRSFGWDRVRHPVGWCGFSQHIGRYPRLQTGPVVKRGGFSSH